MSLVSDEQLAQFSDIYKSILNDHSGRVAIIGRDNYRTFTVHSNGESFSEGDGPFDRCSVQFLFSEDESHWVSLFRGRTGAWQLFDPALPGHVYPLPPAHCKFLRQTFGGYALFNSASPLQVDSDDTWCQTWSLAMLDANWQREVTALAHNPRLNKAAKQHLAGQIVEAYAYAVRDQNMVKQESEVYAKVLANVNLQRSFYRFYTDDVDVSVTPYVRRGQLQRSYPVPRRLFGR